MPEPEEPRTRVVTHQDGDRYITVVMRRSPETDHLTGAEIAAKLDDWRRSQRHLRAVDDPE